MRLRRLRAFVFGALGGRDFDLPGDVLLLVGRNEAGKSTFAAALDTVLYGFEPATRRQHPLCRWNGGDGEDLHLEAELRLDGGGALRVERVLQATGRLRIGEGGGELGAMRLGNRALDLVAGLPREVYRAIYALETAQLEELRGRVRGHVDELLLPTVEALELRPVSEVLQELRRAHQGLWRADRRGKPQSQALREQLAKARSAVRAAAQQEEALRAARAEQEELRRSLERALGRKRLLEQERDDVPFLRALADLEARRRRLGRTPDLADLAGLPLLDPAVLAREIAELEQGLAEPTARLARTELALSSAERSVLGLAAEIEELLACAPSLEAERERVAELGRRSASLRERARGELAPWLVRPVECAELETIAELPLEAAREALLRRLGRAPLTRLGAAGLVGLAAALLVAALLVAQPATALGLAAAAALAGLAGGWVARGLTSPELERLCTALPLRDAVRQRPRELLQLVDALDRAGRALGEAVDCDAGAQRRAAEQERGAARVRTLCARAGVDPGAVGPSGGAGLERLRHALDAARERTLHCERDRAERGRARQELASHGPALRRKRQHLARLERTLRVNVASGVGPKGFQELCARLDAARFLAEREQELERDPRHRRLGGVSRQGLLEATSPAAVAQRDAELERLDDEIGRSRERLGELGALLDGDPGSRQAQAQEEVLELEDRLSALARERDRLALLESILMRAEREFRDAHQPDVLRRASGFLERVTDGRYARLDVGDGPEGGLWVSGAELSEPARVGPPLSRGTLDQIFLCLRLGLLDHLDEGRERLPLLLDDALVRCDAERRERVYELLGEVSHTRQVILLTCQEWLAEEMARAFAPVRIEL